MSSPTPTAELGVFDRFATWTAVQAARPRFFVICVTLIALWAPSFPLFSDLNTWQLVLNSPTTAITFLLVALLQNTQHRNDLATHAKLNSLADALADLLEMISHERDHGGLQEDAEDLRQQVGLEDRMPAVDC